MPRPPPAERRGRMLSTRPRPAGAPSLGVLLLLGCLLASGRAAATPPFPFCAWWVETTPETMNVAYPDTEATYWTTPFVATPDLRLTVRGRYPQARYFSLTVYDSTFGYFTTSAGVTSGLADYRIEPDAGSVNPWQTATGSAGGAFTVTVARDVTPEANATTNALPLVPSTPASGTLPSDVGFLIFRVYVPAGGAGAVDLPTIEVTNARTTTTLRPCTKARVRGLARAGGTAGRIARLLRRLRKGRTPYAPPCGSDCPPLLQFFLPSPAVTSGVFPNPDNAYVSALFEPERGTVVVVRGLAPTSPATVGTGSVGDAVGATPVPWTEPSWQVRYWSVSNNVYEAPYPVVAVGRGSRVVFGGAADLDTPLDAQGRYTVVVSHPADRPGNATAANGVAWLPTQPTRPKAWETLILRNMLPAAAFANAIQQIDPADYADPAAAAAAMGAYYPLMAACSATVFESGGADACFAASTARR